MPVIVGVKKAGSDRAVLEEAARLADAFDEDLHVIHVLSQAEFRELELETVEESGKTVPVEKVREHAREQADEVAAEVLDREYTPVGLVGDEAEEVVEYANNNDAEYLVVGGRKQSAVGKVLFGSVTQSVLLNAEVPVVTIMQEE